MTHERCPQCGLPHYECVCRDVLGRLPKGEYLVTGRRPTAAECERGATLVPSMLDEGKMVWRVPAVGPSSNTPRD
jgi:hypothetical protein